MPNEAKAIALGEVIFVVFPTLDIELIPVSVPVEAMALASSFHQSVPHERSLRSMLFAPPRLRKLLSSQVQR